MELLQSKRYNQMKETTPCFLEHKKAFLFSNSPTSHIFNTEFDGG